MAVVVTMAFNSEVGEERLVLVCGVEVSIVGVEAVDDDAGASGCGRHVMASPWAPVAVSRVKMAQRLERL